MTMHKGGRPPTFDEVQAARMAAVEKGDMTPDPNNLGTFLLTDQGRAKVAANEARANAAEAN